MPGQRLKLKQASAVLQVRPKDLQNLVQFGVIRPRKLSGTFLFDARALLAAKVAFYLKESLGARMSVLSKLMDAFHSSEETLGAQSPNYIVFQCRLSAEDDPIRLGIPIRSMDEQLRRRLGQVALYRDLPRGRKRRGWKKEFLQSLARAANDLGEISEEEILRSVREYRKERRAPKITVGPES